MHAERVNEFGTGGVSVCVDFSLSRWLGRLRDNLQGQNPADLTGTIGESEGKIRLTPDTYLSFPLVGQCSRVAFTVPICCGQMRVTAGKNQGAVPSRIQGRCIL